MAQPQAVYATDEVIVNKLSFLRQRLNFYLQYGRPFIIVREQARKTRSHGVEAIKVCLLLYRHSYHPLTRSSRIFLLLGPLQISFGRRWVQEVLKRYILTWVSLNMVLQAWIKS